jgi:hypothetical protein
VQQHYKTNHKEKGTIIQQGGKSRQSPSTLKKQQIFIIYINDLPLFINRLANVFLFADDTSILVTGKNHCALKNKVTGTLSLIAIWFTANKLVLNISKTNIINCAPKQSANPLLAVSFGN